MSAQDRVLVSAVACTLAVLANAATPGVDDPEAAAPASVAAPPAAPPGSMQAAAGGAPNKGATPVPPPAPAPAPDPSKLDTTVSGMN